MVSEADWLTSRRRTGGRRRISYNQGKSLTASNIEDVLNFADKFAQ
uniref:Uncharacterized protein n=1 Tax=Ciona savignyi TaxID=51511 RepID=H2YX13_CIOSA